MHTYLYGLGDKLRDRVTGQTGIAVSRAEHLFGCARYWIEPQELKDGKPVEGRWIDEDSVELAEAAVIKAKRYRVVDEAAVAATAARSMRLAGGPSGQPASQTGPTTR
jgi:hypothetical protein